MLPQLPLLLLLVLLVPPASPLVDYTVAQTTLAGAGLEGLLAGLDRTVASVSDVDDAPLQKVRVVVGSGESEWLSRGGSMLSYVVW